MRGRLPVGWPPECTTASGTSVPLGESDPDVESNDADGDEQRPLQRGRRFRRTTSSRRALIDPSADASTAADGIELVDAPRPPQHEQHEQHEPAPPVEGRRVLVEPVNDVVVAADVGGRCNYRRCAAFAAAALLATTCVLVLPALSGSVAATLVVRSMTAPATALDTAATVALAPVALPALPPSAPPPSPFAPPQRLCTDVAETCSRFRSLERARAHCVAVAVASDRECTVRGVGASRSDATRELEAVSVLALVPPQTSFVGIDGVGGVDGRAMTQLLELRSYDPESWQACVRALDCD